MDLDYEGLYTVLWRLSLIQILQVNLHQPGSKFLVKKPNVGVYSSCLGKMMKA